MDFRLTEEQRLVRDTARDFVDRELIPHVRDWEEKGEVPKSFYRKMAGLGFLGAPVPEKYAGAGERRREPRDDRAPRWKRMGAERPEAVHLEREHRGLHPGVRAGTGDEA